MENNFKNNSNSTINNQEINNIDESTVSKASSEIMLDRICVNDKKEFPFLNF